MLTYQKLKQQFKTLADPQATRGMKKYMRDQFEFYGYQTKPRKAIYHQGLLQAKKLGKLIGSCWINVGLTHTGNCNISNHDEKVLSYDDLKHIEKCVRSKQWWDTIDTLVILD